jgi:hypothetical protein
MAKKYYPAIRMGIHYCFRPVWLLDSAYNIWKASKSISSSVLELGIYRWASILPKNIPKRHSKVQVLQVYCTPVSHSPTGEVKDGLLQLPASIVTCRLRFGMKGPNVLGYMESNPVSESPHIFEDNFWSDVPLDEETNAIMPTKYHFSDRTLKRSHVVRPYKRRCTIQTK